MNDTLMFSKIANLNQINLLGYFDKANRYWLPDKIVKEIVKSEKIIEKEEENIIYCTLNTAKTRLNLVVYLDCNDPNDIVYARLYLAEKYKENDEEKKLLTFVQKYTSFSKEGFIEKVKTAFRLKNINDDGIDIKNSSYYIDDFLLKKQKLYRTLLNENAQLNKDITQKIVDVLKQTKIGVQIIKELSILMKKSNLKEDSVGYWLYIKEKLEELLKEKENLLTQAQLNMIIMLRQEYLKRYQELNKKFKDLNNKLIIQFQDETMIAPINREGKSAKELKNIPIGQMSKEQKESYAEIVKDENYPYEHDLNNNGELDAFEFFKDNDKTNFFEDIFSDLLGAFTFLSLLDAVFENIIDFGKELNLPFDVFD